MMTIREYKRAESLEEAWQLNQKKANRILGGMIWLKMETINVGTAIDLSGLGLDTIEETDVGFSIGAMVTLRQLETHPGLEAFTHGAVREALRHIVGVQLRNLATVGGSIYSRFGFSDVLTLFLAMDCSVELYKGGIVPLREYAERPYDRDIVVRLLVRKEAADYCYQSVRNSQTDIPVLTCAAARLQDGSYRVLCSTNVEKMFDYFDEEVELDATTVNGWVVLQLDKLPAAGDTFSYRAGNKIFNGRVIQADDRKAIEINLRVEEAPEENNNGKGN